MFSSENIYEKDLNLFCYKNHICYIKDLNLIKIYVIYVIKNI